MSADSDQARKEAPLVLSCFPGMGMLDAAFELEGYCVVRGPDVLWGGDIRKFHPPSGRFEGVIGGDPCQAHSALANLVRAKGLEPSFPDMTGDLARVVEEARPAWFLRENVPAAPNISPAGYDVRSFLLDNSTLDSGDGTGNEQMRRRRWWFGVRDGGAPELRRHIDFALFELPDAVAAVSQYPVNNDPALKVPGGRHRVNAVAGDARESFIPGGQAEVDEINRRRVRTVTSDTGGADTPYGQRKRVTAVCGHDGHTDQLGDKAYREARERARAVTGRHHSKELRTTVERDPDRVFLIPKRSLAEMLRLQGFPEDHFGELDKDGRPKHSPFRVDAMRKMVGNGVSLWMGRALARAIRQATEVGRG